MLFAKSYKRHITVAGLVLSLIILANATLSVYLIGQNTIQEREIQLENLTHVLAAHTTQIIFSADTALDSIMDVVDLGNIETPQQFNAFATHAQQQQLLVDKTKTNPILDVATFVANNGKVLDFSRLFPAPEINLSESDFFQWFSQNDSAKTYFSRPVQNESTGTWVFYLARRVNNSQNEFLGLALVGVSSGIFSELYEKIGNNIGHGVSISLYRDDRTLLSRWPLVDNMIGTVNTNGIIDQSFGEAGKTGHVLFTNGPRFYEHDLRVDRMISYRYVENYPFITGASFTKEMYLGNWLQRSLGIVYSSLVSLFILLLSMVLLLRAHNHNAKIRFQAHYDHLTGLPNRMLLSDSAPLLMSLARRNQSRMAVLYIDLDHFKKINDEMGHEIGDRVLQLIAKRMLLCTRETDIVSRIGGDEFIVLLSEIKDSEAARQVAEKILKEISLAMEIAGQTIMMQASIGIAIYPDHGTDMQDLQRYADQALYASKGNGRNNIRVFKQTPAQES